MSFLRKVNAELVPKKIYFNGIHSSKTMGMPIGSMDVEEVRTRLTSALSEVGVLTLLMVPGSRRSVCSTVLHLLFICLLSLPIPAIFHSKWVARGVLCLLPSASLAGGMEEGGQLLSRSACAAGYRNC